ncbi:DUF2345 domain-containing protein [Chromobacterium piscinae]|uniref:DUF2345 domain-containing protein n=1 Tax=Chromobacterium piscinae TaxID=686831 RepID=UPI0031FCBDAD
MKNNWAITPSYGNKLATCRPNPSAAVAQYVVYCRAISLFVAGVKDKVALKLIAAKGKVQVQTQSDRMEITADKDVTITSCKERVVVNAKQEILVTAGGGYIHIAGGNIEVHCPGTVSVKGTSHDLSGPASMNPPLPTLPKDKYTPPNTHPFSE